MLVIKLFRNVFKQNRILNVYYQLHYTNDRKCFQGRGLQFNHQISEGVASKDQINRLITHKFLQESDNVIVSNNFR